MKKKAHHKLKEILLVAWIIARNYYSSALVGCEGISLFHQLPFNHIIFYICWWCFCKLGFRSTRIHVEANHIPPCICIETILKTSSYTFLLSFSIAAVQMTASNIRRYFVLPSSSFTPKENQERWESELGASILILHQLHQHILPECPCIWNHFRPLELCGSTFLLKSMMAEWLEQVSHWHEMYSHDL